MKKTLLALGLGLLTALGAAAGGCKNAGLSTASICDQSCACEPCTDNDLQACEDAASEARNKARDLGCGAQFNAYVTCAEDHISCRDKAAVVKDCSAERAALNQCGNGLTPGSDPCHDADSLLTSCGLSNGGQIDTCDASAQCFANCVLASDCAELQAVFNGGQSSGSFLACSGACAQQGSTGSSGTGGG